MSWLGCVVVLVQLFDRYTEMQKDLVKKTWKVENYNFIK